MPSGDSRKEYVLATVGNYFGISLSDPGLSGQHDNSALNNFLDDGSCFILAASGESQGGKKVAFQNKVRWKKRNVIDVLKFLYVVSCSFQRYSSYSHYNVSR